MYKKILAAFDGSEKSQNALDHAAEVAEHNHAILFIVHVMKEKTPVSAKPLYRIPHEETGTKENASAAIPNENQKEINFRGSKGDFLLRKARNRLYLEDDQIQTKLLYGDPAREISEFARQEKIDLIIMGNRGLSGLRKMMLGSVSQKLAQQAYCHVLIVK